MTMSIFVDYGQTASRCTVNLSERLVQDDHSSWLLQGYDSLYNSPDDVIQ